MKKILVTGGAGFIGSHLCRSLLKEGNYVICLDNFYTGKMENIKDLKKLQNFEFIRHDIINPILIEIDEIFHLACPASPKFYQKNPIKTIKTNVLGAINVLGLAKRTGAKFLLASTSEVYGDALEHPQKENYWGNVNPIGIRSCYDEGKRIAETLTMEYQRSFKMPVKIVRIFNTYGPAMSEDDGRVVSNFIVQALRGENLTIYGNGNQTRSFCYVSDMVEGLKKMMSCEGITGPVNLGNPEERTIRELAEKIAKIIGRKTKLLETDLPADDPKKRKPDISLAKKVLDWEPKIKLETGLKETIKYFKRELHL